MAYRSSKVTSNGCTMSSPRFFPRERPAAAPPKKCVKTFELKKKHDMLVILYGMCMCSKLVYLISRFECSDV